jgi:hypothetical protein
VNNTRNSIGAPALTLEGKGEMQLKREWPPWKWRVLNPISVSDPTCRSPDRKASVSPMSAFRASPPFCPRGSPTRQLTERNQPDNTRTSLPRGVVPRQGRPHFHHTPEAHSTQGKVLDPREHQSNQHGQIKCQRIPTLQKLAPTNHHIPR